MNKRAERARRSVSIKYRIKSWMISRKARSESGDSGEKTYLKQHKAGVYHKMLLNGKLTQHLIDTNEAALDMMESLVKQMAAAEGVTEDLKRHDQMAWVGRMNNIRNRAEEIVRNEPITC